MGTTVGQCGLGHIYIIDSHFKIGIFFVVTCVTCQKWSFLTCDRTHRRRLKVEVGRERALGAAADEGGGL